MNLQKEKKKKNDMNADPRFGPIVIIAMSSSIHECLILT